MIAVLFEVELNAGASEQYLELASRLKQHLANQPGFICVERFQSLADNNRLLSLSYWQSLEAVSHWKQNSEHQLAQQLGKAHLFRHYQISVVEVLRRYQMEKEPA